MRTNKKQQLLATAMDIVESDGLQGLTYDSLSTATGTSKSGLIYHFPSRRALEVELNKYSASLWTQALEDIAGAPPQQLDLPLRLKAIVINQSTSARRADLFLTLQSPSRSRDSTHLDRCVAALVRGNCRKFRSTIYPHACRRSLDERPRKSHPAERHGTTANCGTGMCIYRFRAMGQWSITGACRYCFPSLLVPQHIRFSFSFGD